MESGPNGWTGKCLKRRHRLCRYTEFKRVRRLGKSIAHPLVLLIGLPNTLAVSRVGVVAGRSIGNAVQRNRVKRQMRACLNSFLPQIKPGWDMIFLARQPMVGARFDDIVTAIIILLKRAGMIDGDQSTHEIRMVEQ